MSVLPYPTACVAALSRERNQSSGLVELCRMYGDGRGRQAHWKRDAPWQVGGPAVVVPDEKTSNPANRVSDGKRGCGHGKYRDLW